VPAGNVLAIGGLDTAILKSATLTDSPAARPLAPMLFQVSRLALDAATKLLQLLAAMDHWDAHRCMSSCQWQVLRGMRAPELGPDYPAPSQAAPIVRVAIEARALGDMGALVAGLDLLHRADPLAEVTLQPSGEHVLGAAGAAVCWPVSGAVPTSVTSARASL
jgi:ribosome assembly protein 1